MNYKLLILYCALFINLTFAEVADILENIWQSDYAAARLGIKELQNEKDYACVLSGINLITRFDDLGDFSDLDSAFSVLTTCETSGFWDALRRYEIGYIHSIKGNTFKSIDQTKSASKSFALLSDTDSRSFYAVYQYYAEALTDWIPFTKSYAEEYLNTLREGVQKTKLFAPILGNSLIWILYDRKNYSEALEITENMLNRYPEHPVFLQTKADMLFKLGRVAEAVKIYKQSENLYTKRAPNTIRYWCAVANLALMDKNDIWKEKLKSDEFKRLKKKMPESLIKDLKKSGIL